jgi:hypothetical protein
LAEELRNIEKKIAALEDGRSPASDESPAQLSPLGRSEHLPGTEWIHQKAGELGVRLRCVEQASRQETGADWHHKTNDTLARCASISENERECG